MNIDEKYRAICFDMDGTLLDTKIDYDKLGSVVRDVLIDIGVPGSKIDDHGSDDAMISDAIGYLSSTGVHCTRKEIDSLIDRKSVDVELENAHLATPFPGTIEMLKELHRRGYVVGVLTRGHRKYAEKVLGFCGVMDRLDAVVAFDDFEEGEEKPNPIAMKHLADELSVRTDEILYLGDSRGDYLCARDAGSGFIGVNSGRYSKERWLKVSPTMITIDCVADLVR
jgi:HAD superfamily hydrolase (TIGR01549 family)